MLLCDKMSVSNLIYNALLTFDFITWLSWLFYTASKYSHEHAFQIVSDSIQSIIPEQISHCQVATAIRGK